MAKPSLNIYLEDDFDNATITFGFDSEFLNDPEFVAAIYYFNDEE